MKRYGSENIAKNIFHMLIIYENIENTSKILFGCTCRSVREINLEGNQLPAMPCGALLLELNYLNVKNNFMHPLFWKENTRNQPQVCLMTL